MGKHERVEENITALQECSRDKTGLRLTSDQALAMGTLIYHRELGLRKIIQCLLWCPIGGIARHGSGIATINVEDMGRASGHIEIKNEDGILIIGAGIPR